MASAYPRCIPLVSGSFSWSLAHLNNNLAPALWLWVSSTPPALLHPIQAITVLLVTSQSLASSEQHPQPPLQVDREFSLIVSLLCPDFCFQSSSEWGQVHFLD